MTAPAMDRSEWFRRWGQRRWGFRPEFQRPRPDPATLAERYWGQTIL